MSPNPSVGADLSIRDGTVFGWRIYTWDGKHLRGRRATPWEGPKLEAVCKAMVGNFYQVWGDSAPEDRPHHLISGDCNDKTMPCGIYMYKSPFHWEFIKDVLSKQEQVYAFCQAWGVVVEHEWGYRAEFVQIEQLYLPTNLMDDVAAAYGVPCREFKSTWEIYRALWPYRDKAVQPQPANDPGRGQAAAHSLNTNESTRFRPLPGLVTGRRSSRGWQYTPRV